MLADHLDRRAIRYKELTKRTKQGIEKHFRERQTEKFLFSRDVTVASLPPQSPSPEFQDSGGVCFGDCAFEDGHDASKDELDPEDPSPTGVFTNETTDDGTKDRPTVGGSSEKRDGEATLLVIPYIGDRSTGERQRS